MNPRLIALSMKSWGGLNEAFNRPNQGPLEVLHCLGFLLSPSAAFSGADSVQPFSVVAGGLKGS